jgi:hypothetical protein
MSDLEPELGVRLLIERLTTDCEHAIVWLPAAAATASLARESDIWAISRGCDPDAIRR